MKRSGKSEEREARDSTKRKKDEMAPARGQPTTAPKKPAMKLLIDTESQKVLFAEAGKDVVDFLFGLLGMPVGSIVRLLSKDHMVGCIGNLYHSLEGLDEAYIQPNRSKTDLLNPLVPSPSFTPNTLRLSPGPTSAKKKYYRCGDDMCDYITDVRRTLCPSCKSEMTDEMSYVEPRAGKVEASDAEVGGGDGLVKGVVTYTVMDDLTVTPMSTISSITLLNKLQVKDMSVLQEKSVELGFKEGLELLQASLQSTTVLTNVFLLMSG